MIGAASVLDTNDTFDRDNSHGAVIRDQCFHLISRRKSFSRSSFCPKKRGKGFSEVLSGDILFTHEFTRLPIQL